VKAPQRAPAGASTRPSSKPHEDKGGAKPSANARAATQGAPQQVRIIGGQFKRSPLVVPDWPGLRPTPSRVRETLFNWLGQDLSGWRVLDAFAGTGALGLEAASRGATDVVALEREPKLARQIQANAQKLGALGFMAHAADALAWMQTKARQAPEGAFDLIFLDPPFSADLFDAALVQAMACVPLDGWIYLEADNPIEARAGLRLHRKDKAGAVHFHLFQRCLS
jgi:16S rRNA (guanine966-N2)-methyltransferase